MKKGWEVRQISHVCRLINGRAYKKAELLESGRYPVLRVGNFFTNNHWYYSDLELDQDKYCEDGDLLYAWSASFGPRIWKGGKVIYHYHIWKIEPCEGVDRDFLYYFFDWDKELIKKEQGTGATMIHVSKGSMEARAIPLPPLEEQHRIVAILDEAFQGLDRARENVEANIKDARELFESYLSNAFAKDCNNWSHKTLNAISVNLDRQRIPITKANREPGDVPYYGASGVVDYVANYIFDEDLLLVSEDGANLLARTYPIAFSISGKSWVNNHAHVLKFPDIETQEFVRLYLNLIPLTPYVSGMAQPKLNQAALNKIPIPFPDIQTRTAIVRNAEHLAEETSKLIEFYEKSFQDLNDLRQSLLHKAFAGELT